MSSILDIKTVLYATDMGSHMRQVFRHAVSFAKKYDARMLMVHVMEPLNDMAQAVISSYLSEDTAKKVQKDDMEEVFNKMKERLQKFSEEELGATSSEESQVQEIIVVSGSPSEEIIRVAKEHSADMIVMGKSSRSLFGNVVMGSTTRRVTKYSEVPVVVIPNDL